MFSYLLINTFIMGNIMKICNVSTTNFVCSKSYTSYLYVGNSRLIVEEVINI